MIEKIINDKFIIEKYNEIDKNEKENNAWAHHNMKHAIRVCSIAEELLKKLNYERELIEAVKIACILHDLGCAEGKENHAYKGAVIVEEYFKLIKYSSKYKSEIVEAIREHSDGFKSNNIITLSLIIADKLDIDKRRIAPGGLYVEGMRQLQYIREIKKEIIDGILKINFLTMSGFDKKECEGFYFMDKVVKSVKSFAIKNKLKYEFFKDGERWNLNKKIT